MRIGRRVLRWVVASILAAMMQGGVWAQSGSGDLAGSVTDVGGAVIAGASITVGSQSAVGVKVRTATTVAGNYALTSLRPGTYTVRVEAAGFATVERAGITVRTGVRERIDVELHPGGADQVVNVTADASPLVSESG